MSTGVGKSRLGKNSLTLSRGNIPDATVDFTHYRCRAGRLGSSREACEGEFGSTGSSLETFLYLPGLRWTSFVGSCTLI